MTNNVFQYMLLCFFPETLILLMKILNSFQFVEFTIYYQYVLYFMFLKLSFINVMVSCKDYDSENVKTTYTAQYVVQEKVFIIKWGTFFKLFLWWSILWLCSESLNLTGEKLKNSLCTVYSSISTSLFLVLWNYVLVFIMFSKLSFVN